MKKRLTLIRFSVMFIIALFLFSTLSAGFASAKISVTEPKSAYNLGDEMSLTIKTLLNSVSGFFKTELICNNNSLVIEKFVASRLAVNEEQTTSMNLILIPDYIEQLSGKCYIVVSVGDEKTTTKEFVISNKINVNAELDKKNYKPGEKAILKVRAVKENSMPLNGFIQVSGEIDLNKEIKNGDALIEFLIPEASEAGSHALNLFAYDNNQLNTGYSNISFEVDSEPSSIGISLLKLEANPGENFDIGIDLYDQSGLKIGGKQVSVTLISPDNKQREMTVNSGRISAAKFETNSLPGTWKISAKFSDITAEKEFQMNMLQKADFYFEDSVLIVRNIGNTAYNKTIKIEIGDETREIQINLNIGEEKRFNLNAPEGEYKVLAGDDSDNVEKTLFLTGRAVSVSESSGLNVFSYPLLWIFILLILFLTALILLFKFKGRTIKLKEKIKSHLPHFHKEEGLIDISRPKTEAESSLVLEGEKSNSAVILLKVKNYRNLSKSAGEEIEKAIDLCREKKAVVEWKEEYAIIIFSPLITKTFKNEALALKTGFALFKKIKDYNKRFNEKIEFNIGIHSGDLVASLDGKKLKYAGIGNTISLAKKMSDLGSEKVFVSDNIRKKFLKDLKVKKMNAEGVAIYEAESLADNRENKEKLTEILKRMKQEERK